MMATTVAMAMAMATTAAMVVGMGKGVGMGMEMETARSLLSVVKRVMEKETPSFGSCLPPPPPLPPLSSRVGEQGASVAIGKRDQTHADVDVDERLPRPT